MRHMDWLEDVRGRLKRRNQILFSKSSPFLQDLEQLIGAQSHRAVILWALELADEAVGALLTRYPEERRPEAAVATARDWAAGRVKMPVAQRAILDAHAAAKGIDSPEDIALIHAVGQACGVVHTTGHAIGFPMYELTAIVRRFGVDDCRAPVEARMRQYIDRIRYWSAHYESVSQEWADFLV